MKFEPTESELNTIVVLRALSEDIAAKRDGGCEVGETVAKNAFLARLWVNLKTLGIDDKTNRAERLTFLSYLFKRKLSSANELNHAEVSALCMVIQNEVTMPDMKGLWEKVAEYRRQVIAGQSGRRGSDAQQSAPADDGSGEKAL